jgi:Arc/MetJ-type ribon-helix-helix transcriptional regulator
MPIKIDETVEKYSVTLYKRQIAWLSKRAGQIQADSGKRTSVSELIREAVELLISKEGER